MKILRRTFSNPTTCLLDMDASSMVSIFVQTVHHLVDSKLVAPGARDDIVEELKDRERIVRRLAIHLMIGASLLLLPLLKNVPMAVLYGLFLFMGVVSMRGNQFFQRLSLWAALGLIRIQ